MSSIISDKLQNVCFDGRKAVERGEEDESDL